MSTLYFLNSDKPGKSSKSLADSAVIRFASNVESNIESHRDIFSTSDVYIFQRGIISIILVDLAFPSRSSSSHVLRRPFLYPIFYHSFDTTYVAFLSNLVDLVSSQFHSLISPLTDNPQNLRHDESNLQTFFSMLGEAIPHAGDLLYPSISIHRVREVFVRVPAGAVITIKDAFSVAEIKQQVTCLIGIPFDQQRLVLTGRQLDDCEKLTPETHTSVIQLLLRYIRFWPANRRLCGGASLEEETEGLSWIF